MLTLQLCGLALSAVSAVPSPAWQTLTGAAYGCPVALVRSDAPLGLTDFNVARGLPSRAWRIVPASGAAGASRGDGVVLPDDPWQVLTQPELRRTLARATASGAVLLVPVTDAASLGTLATTYAGLGLTPRAAVLRENLGPLNLWPPGTFVVKEVDGLALLPHVARLGERIFVPYSAQQGPGERATPQATRSTLDVQPYLTWAFAGQVFDSRAPLPLGQRVLGAGMVAAWTVGRALSVSLPSVLFLASSALAWLVLAVIVVTSLLLFWNVRR